jgi:hypothetical protein
MEEMRSEKKLWSESVKGRNPFTRPRCRCEDVEEIEWKGVDWIHLAQDRNQWRALVNAVMNL